MNKRIKRGPGSPLGKGKARSLNVDFRMFMKSMVLEIRSQKV